MSKHYPKLTFLLIAILVVLLCVGVSKGKRISEKYRDWLYQPLPAVTTGGFSLPGSYYELSLSSKDADPKKTAHYHDFLADYRLWVPEGIEKTRGLIVKQHGCGDGAAATGLDHANDVQWQVLAAKHKFALLGTKYNTGDQPCEEWALMNNGSKDIFLEALRVLAEKSKQPELEEIPWVLWGHSGGADWVVEMFQEYPSRTIAIVAVRGGGSELYGRNPTLAGIPVLFALGEKDPYASETIEFPRQAFSRYRNIDAPWTLAIEPNAAHETGNSRFFAIPYLDAVIHERLTASNKSLIPIDVTKGWLGNTITHDVAPANRYQDNPLKAAWLPNEEIARKWQEYVIKGEIAPTQKPVSPIEVRTLKDAKKGVIITWNYAPDLNTGLPSFHIYRDNSLIARVKGQDHNFNDAPISTSFALRFIDQSGRSDSIYTVAAFNTLGESTSNKMQVVEVN